MHIIHTMNEGNQDIAEALQKIQQSCDECAKGTLKIWLDGNDMEEKLQMQRREDTNKQQEDLFAKTGATVGFLHPFTISSNIKDLKETYLRDNFATVSACGIVSIKQNSYVC